MDQQLPTTTISLETDLFSSVYTERDLLLFYKEIDQIIADMFKGNNTFEQTLGNILSPKKKTSILSYLHHENVNLERLVDVKVALSKIQKLGNSLPVVSLTLAIEPTEKITEDISFWFTKRFGKKVLLSFSLERSMIGGAYVSFDGLYKDYTLKTKIEKYFNKQ